MPARIDVDMMSMFLSIIKVVILPIAGGFIINYFFVKITQKIVEILPLISSIVEKTPFRISFPV